MVNIHAELKNMWLALSVDRLRAYLPIYINFFLFYYTKTYAAIDTEGVSNLMVNFLQYKAFWKGSISSIEVMKLRLIVLDYVVDQEVNI